MRGTSAAWLPLNGPFIRMCRDKGLFQSKYRGDESATRAICSLGGSIVRGRGLLAEGHQPLPHLPAFSWGVGGRGSGSPTM